MTPDIDMDRLGASVLDAGRVEPAALPAASDKVHPIAFDSDGDLAAVSFAVCNLHPTIAQGWWCVAQLYSRCRDQWIAAGGEHDNVTTCNPFQRPEVSENSTLGWVDWLSFGGAMSRQDPPGGIHSFFGVAPSTTARLAVVDSDQRARSVRITPWNGAFVAVVMGDSSTLVGYGLDGGEIGRQLVGSQEDS